MANYPINNQIFEHFRKQEREINNAITVLEKRGFSVYEKKNKLVIYRD